MQNVALAWLVIELSGSPLAIGALAFWRFVPFTVFGLVAGVVADRISSRKLVMATQAAAMAISIALAVVTLTGTATLPLVYLLAALGGVALAFDAPAGSRSRSRWSAHASSRTRWRSTPASSTGRGSSARRSQASSSRRSEPGACFVLNAVSFLAVLTALAIVREEELHPVATRPVGATIIGGLRRAVRRTHGTTRSCDSILGVVTVVATVGFNFHVLVPLLAADTLHVGPEGFGLLSAAFGLGALVGALATATLPRARAGACSRSARRRSASSRSLLAPVQNAVPRRDSSSSESASPSRSSRRTRTRSSSSPRPTTCAAG